MATRKTHTYEVTVKTIGGSEFTATDTESSKAGTNARMCFLHGNVIEIEGDNATTYVPYHAIDYVTIEATEVDETYTDSTCVTDDGETGETETGETETGETV